MDKCVQIENLLGRCDWFASGSKIIITTRDKHLGATLGKCFSVYEVKELDQVEALELFRCMPSKATNPKKIIWNLQTKLYNIPGDFISSSNNGR